MIAHDRQTFVDILRRQAQRRAEEIAFRFLPDGEGEGIAITFGELDRKARTIAARLRNEGFAGGRALLLFPPGLDYISAFFGCLYAGVVAVPIYPPRFGRGAERSLPRLRAIAADAGPVAALTLAESFSAIEAALPGLPDLASMNWIATDSLPDSSDAWRDPGATPGTLAFLQYTSGSTATPKGVMVTHGNLVHNQELIRQGNSFDQSTRMATWLPLYHDMGLIGTVLQPIFLGIPCVLIPPVSFLQRPLRWLQAISRFGCTASGGPNFAYELCVRKTSPEQRAELDLGSWRVAFNGAEPIKPDTIDRFCEAFAGCGFRREAFLPCYGLAEATLFVTGGPADRPPIVLEAAKAELEQGALALAAGSDTGRRSLVGSGRTWPHLTEVAIVDPRTRQRLPQDRVGEIWLAGPSIAQGYWNRPEASEETFRARIAEGDDRGWLRTGDLGVLHGDELVVTSRLKDVIILRGRNHAPQDLEDTAERSHPALRAGCGMAFTVEGEGGEEERLVIVYEVDRERRRVSFEEVAAAVRRAISEGHELRLDEFVLVRTGTIPKTLNGKLQRQACRRDFLSGKLEVIGRSSIPAEQDGPAPVAAGPTARSASEIRAWLVAALSRRLAISPAELDVRKPLASYGLGSADAVGLAGDLQDWLGRAVAPTVVYEHPAIEELARHLTGGDPRAAAPDHAGRTSRQPIAIVGIGCRFPGANDPGAFWRLLSEGRDAVSEVPKDRWDADAFFDPDPDAPGKTNTRWGGFLEGIEKFDADFFHVSPREASRQDPQQRILLEVAWEALEDAGIPADSLAGSRTGVFIGISANEYARLQVEDPLQIDAYVGTGNALSVAANRISYQLGLRGPSLAVDTACSSSLVAVHLACRSVWDGESRLALAGGANLVLSPAVTINFTKAGVMSPDGRCKTFDARADGYVRGEGAAVVVLKPLADALRDGDLVHAVIRGGAIGHGGRTNGIMAPSRESQEAVLREACEEAGISPAQVQYVEAHGTGTSLGDTIEASALGAVFGAEREGGTACRIGSVKTNIGHLEAAAGVAGLVKVALSLEHRALPASLHFTRPNPKIAFQQLGLHVQEALTPWPDESRRLLAGVSSFGFGGTNAHLVLEEAPNRSAAEAGGATASAGGPFLLALSARSDEALRSLAATHLALARAGDGPASLEDVCYSAGARRSHHDERLAVVARSRTELRARLEGWLAGRVTPEVVSGRASTFRRHPVFVFSGQGPQWPGMGRELFASQRAFRDAFERCDEAIRAAGGPSPMEGLGSNADAARLEAVEIVQPALFAHQVALAALWRSWGIIPGAVVGHSMGEVAAAHVAGVLSLEDAARVICLRSQLLAQLRGQGAMAVAGLPLAEARACVEASGSRLSIAASNGPASVVLSGDPAAIDDVVRELQGRNVFARRVKVDVAAHSPQVERLCPELVDALSRLSPGPSNVPVYSTVAGGALEGPSLDARYWARNLREPVLFSETIARAAADGHDVFVEISPHPVLDVPIQQTLAGSATAPLVVPSGHSDESEHDTMLRSLATLYTRGSPVSWSGVFGQQRRWVRLPTYPWRRQRFWFDCKHARVADGPREVRQPQASPVLHPLLGRRVDVATSEAVFEAILGETRPPYLAEHRVYGAAVLPATAYLELFAAAARQLGGEGTVEDLTIQEAMLFTPGEDRVVQVVAAPLRPGEFRVRVVSRSERSSGSAGWTLHAEGTLRLERAPEDGLRSTGFSLDLLRDKLTSGATSEENYAEYDRRGIQYAGAFRGVLSLWRHEGEALGAVELPASASPDGYEMHPALLDACFQVAAAGLGASPCNPGDVAYMPLGLERYRLHRRPGRRVWSYVRIRSAPEAQREAVVCDVTVGDEEGRLIASVEGLCLKRAARESLARLAPAAPDWFYEVRWTPQPRRPGASASGTPAPLWLLLSDRTGVGDALRDKLRGRGSTVLTLRAASESEPASGVDATVDLRTAGEVRRRVRELRAKHGRVPLHVVHLWGLAAPADQGADGESLPDATALCCASVLELVQELSGGGPADDARLWVATRSCQAAGDPPVVNDPAAAALWGLGRVIALEHPTFWGGLVDLDGARPEAAASALLEEIESTCGEDQVALRDGRRWVARLVRAAAPTTQPVRFRPDATYLVTGGLGALGLRCARWMVQQGARHLTLVGRSGLPARTAWSGVADGRVASRIAAVRELESAGATVRVVAADVGDLAQMRRVVATELDLPLRGIFHAAGISDVRDATGIDRARLGEVLRPKVAGAWNLHQLTKGADLDAFVLFSSAASLWGSQGLAHYAAANAFLDALAHHRRVLGLPALSVNWARLSEAGMVSSSEAHTLEAIGLGSLPVDDAFPWLGRLISSGSVQRAVAAVDWSVFKPVYEARQHRPFLEDIEGPGPAGRPHAAPVPVEGGGDLLRELEGVPRSRRREVVQSHLEALLVEVLGSSDGRAPDSNRGFFEMGMDSIMAVRLKRRLEASVQRTLPTTLAFDHPTIASLRDYLVEQLHPGEAEQRQKPMRREPALCGTPDDVAALGEAELVAMLSRELADIKGGSRG